MPVRRSAQLDEKVITILREAQNIKLVEPDKTFGFVLHRLAGSR